MTKNIEELKKEAREKFLADEDIKEVLHNRNNSLYYTENKIIAHIEAAIDRATLAERNRIIRKIGSDFIIFVRPEANIVDWLAQDHNGDYHRLQEVSANQAIATAIEREGDL